MMTVHKGGIEKYIEPAVDLVRRYGLDEYYTDRLKQVMDEIASLFHDEDDEELQSKQLGLTDFLKG